MTGLGLSVAICTDMSVIKTFPDAKVLKNSINMIFHRSFLRTGDENNDIATVDCMKSQGRACFGTPRLYVLRNNVEHTGLEPATF